MLSRWPVFDSCYGISERIAKFFSLFVALNTLRVVNDVFPVSTCNYRLAIWGKGERCDRPRRKVEATLDLTGQRIPYYSAFVRRT